MNAAQLNIRRLELHLQALELKFVDALALPLPEEARARVEAQRDTTLATQREMIRRARGRRGRVRP